MLSLLGLEELVLRRDKRAPYLCGVVIVSGVAYDGRRSRLPRALLGVSCDNAEGLSCCRPVLTHERDKLGVALRRFR